MPFTIAGLFDAPRASCAPVEEPFFRVVHGQHFNFDGKFGPGEGIRTLDPNLGKVGAYLT
jgi:hypothetical protein